MLDRLIDLVGDQYAFALGGALIGLLFGALAQRSRFCLRTATLEVAHGEFGEKLAIWLFTFSTALIATQALILLGLFETGTVRQLNNRGSLSGAVLGGLMFGCGMTFTRACASRMLVLSATGNLRALLSGLVFAVVAQMSRDGALSPLRSAINGWWTVDGGSRDLLALTGLGHGGALLFGCCWLAMGMVIARRRKLRLVYWLTGAGVGLTVAAAWAFNYAMSLSSFELAPVHALSFTSPSADVLMYVLSPPGVKVTFDLGLIPGVFVGAFLAAAAGGDLKLEGFKDGAGMRRYIAGGCLMGFGGVLAGGCAVGAGVSGASVFASTAWIVLWSMWIGAVFTDRLVDQKKFWGLGHVAAN
ncbi:YeeE/YedE family protein [uncultured Rhodoblastus sp.]|uniref:YeeE/YedE family protein n=1 Tax=uncultured Rhodoblastus sp. TaxID=543037 RepID=UPI0025F164E7|nr:YeeE/YedE family protein [uncultured Rhodoblastus sp.]